MTGLALRDVRLALPDGSGTARTILDGVTVEARPGKLTVVRGPSGSGKTTLLGVAALWRRPDAGQILLDGTDVTHTGEPARTRTRRAALSLAPQSPAFLESASARDNLLLALAAVAAHPSDRLRRSDEALDELGLSGLAARPARSLSEGERLRLSLARALVTAPRVLLADEPTAALDEASASVVRAALRRRRESGQAQLVCTHDDVLRGDLEHRLDGGRLAPAEGPS